VEALQVHLDRLPGHQVRRNRIPDKGVDNDQSEMSRRAGPKSQPPITQYDSDLAG